MRGRRRAKALGTAALGAALLLPAGARAADYHVAAGNPGCAVSGDACTTIGQAAARVLAGDRVLIAPGTYAETVTFDDAVEVRPEGAGLVRVTGAGAGDDVLTFTRSVVLRGISLEASGNGAALRLISENGDPTTKTAVLESSSLSGGSGASGAGLRASSESVPVVGSTAGGITITGRHLTIAGGTKSIALNADANGVGQARGSIAATVTSSIVHGATETTNFIGPPFVSNTATISPSNNETSGNAAIFRSPGARDYRLRVDAGATLIEAGSALAGGEHTFDLEGQNRTLDGNADGTAATDRGADEVLNAAPSPPTTVTPTPASTNTGVSVGFTASGAADPEAAFGGGIAGYRWDFGDGSPTEDTPTAAAAHSYSNVGNYNVRVRAIDAQGFVGAQSIAVQVAIGAAPPVTITVTVSLTARLSAAATSALQGRSIVFDASASTAPGGGIAAYRFDYGDGVTETSGSPRALHAFRRTGTFAVRVVVVAPNGLASAPSDPVRVRIGDGVEPTVAIRGPRQNQALRRSASILVSGTGRDASGVRRIEVALRLLQPVTRRNRCRWLGLRGLVGGRCDRPLWRTARLTRSGWSYRVPARNLPAGPYELRVRATDRAGNVSTAADPASRTLISFRLR